MSAGKQLYEARKAQRIRKRKMQEAEEKLKVDSLNLAQLAISWAIAFFKGKAAIMIGELPVRLQKDADA